MNPAEIHQFLVLYTWFPLAVLLLLLVFIGRFYQKFSGERTYFWLYLFPVITYGAVSVRLASQESSTDLATVLIGAVSAVILLILCLRLFHCMLRNKGDRPG